MPQPESKLSRKIMDLLRSNGAFCFKVWGSDHTMAGLPDIIVCYQGKFYGFETKVPEKRAHTSARQDYVHGLIQASGGVACVVTSPHEALDIMLGKSGSN